MNLSSLRPPKGSTHRKKRIGRGPASGRGETAGRGENGQKSRSGYSRRLGFEGGQMPLIRRVPKRGFHNMFRKEFAVINLERLNELEGSDFTPELLVERRVVRNLQNGLKILAEGEITRAINVSAHKISKTAQQKIEAAGGKVTIIDEPVHRSRKAVETEPDATSVAKAAKKAAKKAAPKKAAKKAAKKVAKKAPKKDA